MSKKLISIEDAKKWTKNYQDNMKSGDAKAFLISCETIIDILKEMKVIQETKAGITLNDVENSSIRAYLAVNPSQTKANGQTLVMVGTKKDSSGVERDIVEGEVNPPYSRSEVNGSGTFDFIVPCPDRCDENSPLNH
ncbi:hypothetical protein DFQ05_1415 [Winogradskyella wandonensis]|uniref:Uncharacterized protein n=1 Tax=Winogradskyella wandonensis TaxID=1442586 RepID=A0A4R1KRG4_9FLAO|nr:hypothetical protein [Winogradskyella wandonensis]TCK67636.1 hypothetical protein DFQ05_1415 [Winogradskyella wandonensis]